MRSSKVDHQDFHRTFLPNAGLSPDAIEDNGTANPCNWIPLHKILKEPLSRVLQVEIAQADGEVLLLRIGSGASMPFRNDLVDRSRAKIDNLDIAQIVLLEVPSQVEQVLSPIEVRIRQNSFWILPCQQIEMANIMRMGEKRFSQQEQQQALDCPLTISASVPPLDQDVSEGD